MTSLPARASAQFALVAGLSCGFVHAQGAIAPGHRIYAPQTTDTYMVDRTGALLQTWPSTFKAGVAAYMGPDGNLVRAITTTTGGAGVGGGVQKVQLDGTVVWDFRYDASGFTPHHDIAVLANGNVMMIVGEDMTRAEAIAAGRNPALTPSTGVEPDFIIEVQPTGPNTGVIVWEWHVWDHMVQDFDATKSNFDDVSAHPELWDINFPTAMTSDLHHMNSIEYDPVNDWVILSANAQDEVWIIDHSTTTAEAAGHVGGNHGKGGDILYRWGNPRAYRAGTLADQQLFHPHSMKRVQSGYPGAGNLTIFNNQFPGGSEVWELQLPLDDFDHFVLGADGKYGPTGPLWSYADPGLCSLNQSSAERLPNGNTLICSTLQTNIFEIDDTLDTVWEFNPGGPPFSFAFHATYTERTLWSDTPCFSAASGDTIKFDVIAGTPFAGDLFVLLGTSSGTVPGLTFAGLTIPLNPDDYFFYTFYSANGPVFTNSFGTLDGIGRAAVSMVVPAGAATALAGSTLHHAVVTLDPASFRPTSVSNAVPLVVAP